MTQAYDHNRVTPEGRKIGENTARMADKAAVSLAAQGEPDERCKSCAFRAGTVPNGCIQTQADALKAVVENVPFLCHQHDRKGRVCYGWFAARVAIRQAEKVRGTPPPVVSCPWEFSLPDPIEEEAP